MPSLIIDCITRDERVHGFPYSQLINYVLEANPALQSNRDAPPERLTIGFSSHDVVILGWRMRALTMLLHDAKAGTIRTIDIRYGNLSKVEPFIAEIIVTPIKGIP
jgi:hypothetical protein